MKNNKILALLVAGVLIDTPFSQKYDALSCLANTISDNDEFDNYDYTSDEFYNMMLNHKDQINEMLKSDNAYLARGGQDSYSFDLSGFREWNEDDLTNILELASSYLTNMQNNRLADAQDDAKSLVNCIEDSIVELAFMAEDNKYKSLTETLDRGTDSNVVEEDDKIIYLKNDENGMNDKHVYASIGSHNYAFNALSSFNLSTYGNDKTTELDKSPVYLVDSFLLAVSKPIYNPTLYNQTSYNVIWDDKNVASNVYTEWFYDIDELQGIYLRGFDKFKNDLGFNSDEYLIKVDNSINGFKIQKKDETIEYTIQDDQEIPWIVLTELCNIQGLSKATSSLSTFDTSVNYSDSINTVSAFLDDDPNFKVLKLEYKNVN